jgi:5-methylcytosine-specific restriction endonuclease McrA
MRVVSYFKKKPIRLKGNNLKRLKEACIDRDRVCLYSGSPFNLQTHHVVPLGRGGGDTLGNLATVTAEVHDRIHKEWLNVSGIAPNGLIWVEKTK